ncbi:NUDIX domain-containing protein [bacterium]|nr:NUDIX domain-containing protein [bacterium]
MRKHADPTIRAIFDIGSNSLKFAVIKQDKDSLLPLLEAERALSTLANFSDNKLPEEYIDLVCNRIEKLLDESKPFEIDEIQILGTGTFRQCDNRKGATNKFRQDFGATVRILTSQEEATAGYLAVRKEIGNENPMTVLDIGGGSVEFSCGDGLIPENFQTIAVGIHHLQEEVEFSDPPDKNQIEIAHSKVADFLSPLDQLQSHENVVMIGGIARSLGGYAKTLMGAPGSVIADELYIESIERLIKIFSSYTLEERQNLPGAHPKHAENILHGAIFVYEVMKHLKLERVHLSTTGIHMGVLHSAISGLPLSPIEPVYEFDNLDFPPINREDRNGEVLFILRRPDGKIWLQTKEGYPEDVYRIPGGGVKTDENVREAAVREIAEETGFLNTLPIPLLKINYHDSTNDLRFYSVLFLVEVDDRTPDPLDKEEMISDWQAVLPENFSKHINFLENELGELSYWGKFRAVALREIQKLSLEDRF